MTETNDSNKPAKPKSDELILDSDELFDLDMPLDEPDDDEQVDTTGARDIGEHDDETLQPDPVPIDDTSLEDMMAASFDAPITDDTTDEGQPDAAIPENSQDDKQQDQEALKDDDLPEAAPQIDKSATGPQPNEIAPVDDADDLETLFAQFDASTDTVDVEQAITGGKSHDETPAMEDISGIEDELAFMTGHNAQPPTKNEQQSAPFPDPIPATPSSETSEKTDTEETSEKMGKMRIITNRISSILAKKSVARSLLFVLGAVLSLITAGATWLASSAADRVSQLEQVTAPVAQDNKVSGDAREKRLSAIEETQRTVHDAQEQRIAELEQQVATLTTVIANTASKQWQAAVKAQAPLSDQAITPVSTLKQAKISATSEKNKSPVSTKPATKEKASRSTEEWAVNLTSYDTLAKAKDELSNYRKRGIKAEYIRLSIKGKIWYRLRVRGFPSEHEAVAYEKYIKDFQDIDAWHHKL